MLSTPRVGNVGPLRAVEGGADEWMTPEPFRPPGRATRSVAMARGPPSIPEEGSELATTDAFFDQNNLDWQDVASCNDYDNILFFGEEGESEIDKQAREAHAKSICQRCPVREPCLEFAMETNQKYGIWGGLTDKERASLKRRRARARRAS